MQNMLLDIARLDDSIPHASISVLPVLAITELSGTQARETMKFMIEARGSDGSYTRCFTQRTIWEKQV